MANRQIVINKKPGDGNPVTEEHFRVESCDCPTSDSLKENEVLVRTLYSTIDSRIRMFFNDENKASYFKPANVGEIIFGVEGIGVVQFSNADNFKSGDIVKSMHWPWQLFSILKTDALSKIDTAIVGDRITTTISCYGITGLTSLISIRENGFITPGKNETFVCSAAAGAYGILAGQIAKLEGCGKTIGICGSDVKCTFLLDKVGYDDAVNYKKESFKGNLKEACPRGIDIYFDSVGGDISEAVIELMNEGGRIVLCGQSATYASEGPYPPPLKEYVQNMITTKGLQRNIFAITNYKDKFSSSLQQLAIWLKDDKLKVYETIEEGFENAPKAYVKMCRGENVGRQLVHVADP